VFAAAGVITVTVQDWLDHGLGGRDPATVETRRILAHRHVIPALGARKLVELSAEDVDRWLAIKAGTLRGGLERATPAAGHSASARNMP
jgi:hypothetical protein